MIIRDYISYLNYGKRCMFLIASLSYHFALSLSDIELRVITNCKMSTTQAGLIIRRMGGGGGGGEVCGYGLIFLLDCVL